jgi:hypothetical protein
MHASSKPQDCGDVKPAPLTDAEFRQIFRATVYGRRRPINGMIITPKGQLAALQMIDAIDASDITMAAMLRHLVDGALADGAPISSTGRASDAEFRSAFRATVANPPTNLDDEAILVMLGIFDADDGATPPAVMVKRCFLMMQGGGDAH